MLYVYEPQCIRLYTVCKGLFTYYVSQNGGFSFLGFFDELRLAGKMFKFLKQRMENYKLF